MTKIHANVALALALVCPVAVLLFLLFAAHAPLVISATIAVVAGWAANVAWARSADRLPIAGETVRNNTQIAERFGWLCPAVLVVLAWAILRFALGLVA